MSKCVKNNKSVLLVGANLRAMFFVARKLWQSEWVVDVVDFEPIPIQNSKYIRKYYKLEQDNNLDNLADKIIDVVKGVGHDVVIPINDVGVLVCNTIGLSSLELVCEFELLFFGNKKEHDVRETPIIVINKVLTILFM